MVFGLCIVCLIFRLLVLVWRLRLGVLLLNQVAVWSLCLRYSFAGCFVGGLVVLLRFDADYYLADCVDFGVYCVTPRLRWVCIMACMELFADLLFW